MGSERLRRKGERHISLLLPLSLILTIWGNFNESVWQIKIQIISSDSTLTVAKMKRTGSEAAKKGKDPALEQLCSILNQEILGCQTNGTGTYSYVWQRESIKGSRKKKIREEQIQRTGEDSYRSALCPYLERTNQSWQTKNVISQREGGRNLLL